MEVRAHTIGGAGLSSFFEWFGELGLLTARAARAAIHPPYELREFFRHLDEAGSKSAPLVAVAGAAIGVVLSLETRNSLISFGAESALPAILTISVIRETGPIRCSCCRKRERWCFAIIWLRISR